MTGQHQNFVSTKKKFGQNFVLEAGVIKGTTNE